MYLSSKALRRILFGLIAVAIVLGLLAGYFYFPTIINKLGMNKTPSKEIQQLLTDYNTTQTPEGYLELDKKVAKMAVNSPSLDISNCTPYPRITKVDINRPLKVTNSDTINHTLTMRGNTYEIVSGSSLEISMLFTQTTPSVALYFCDNQGSFGGIIYVTGTL